MPFLNCPDPASLLHPALHRAGIEIGCDNPHPVSVHINCTGTHLKLPGIYGAQ